MVDKPVVKLVISYYAAPYRLRNFSIFKFQNFDSKYIRKNKKKFIWIFYFLKKKKVRVPPYLLETLNPYNFCSEFERQIILLYSESARRDESNGIKIIFSVGGGIRNSSRGLNLIFCCNQWILFGVESKNNSLITTKYNDFKKLSFYEYKIIAIRT